MLNEWSGDGSEHGASQTAQERALETAGPNRNADGTPTLGRIRDGYARVTDLQGRIEEIVQESQATALHLQELRKSLEFAGGETATDVSAMSELDRLHTDLEDKLRQVRDAEAGFLGVPQMELEAVDRRRVAIKTSNRGIGEVALEVVVEETEETLRESRQAFVEGFLEEAKSEIDDEVGEAFAASENGERARELLEAKIETQTRHRAEDFVKNGGEITLGFVATLKIGRVPVGGPEGGERQFITDIDFDWTGDGGEPAEAGDEETEEKLLGRDRPRSSCLI